MMATSAWTKATERGLDPISRDASFLSNDPEATFQPELISDERIREKVRSSGYGSKVIEKKNPDGPTWEEIQLEDATFAPQMRQDPIREKVKSTGYGKGEIIYGKPVPEPELPTFQPRVTTTPQAVALRRRSSSAGYGKGIASHPTHKIADPPKPDLPFSPQLPKDGVREKVRSSGYGQTWTPPVKPKPTPKTDNVVLRHTLLADKSKDDVRKENEMPSDGRPEFRNDGVQVALSNAQTIRYGMTEPITVYEKPTPTKQARIIKEKARSSNYHKNYSPSTKRPSKEEIKERVYGNVLTQDEVVEGRNKAERLKFTKKTLWDETPIGHVPENPAREELKEKVHSSGYLDWQPEVGEKREITPEPRFEVSKPKNAIKSLEELPPAPMNPLNAQVGGHGYGVVSPEVGEKPVREEAPVWRSTSKNNGILPLEKMPPAPKPSSRGSSRATSRTTSRRDSILANSDTSSNA